ncbi:MAG: BACON domain-containing protein [Methanosarcinales archaeon]|nr:BACON domain-containing protein [Methanosarcinales archaeon]
MTGQMGRTMIVIVLVVATLIASSGAGAAKNMDKISCTYSISITSQSFVDIGGSGNVSVASESDCSWTTTSNDGWITVTSGDSGSGSGTVGYSVAANPDADSRTGTITIAGETFTVTQDGISCTYSISPTSQSFGDIGGSRDVSVASQGDCSWTATSNDDWITVISGDSGSGSGTVGYSVAANPDADSRTGTITIAGETFTVTQDGISCTYSISPTSQSFGDIGGSRDVSVASQGDCSWTATSNDNWITVTSGNSGSGSGTVGYSVAANPDDSSRTGTITIVDETFTVTQDGIDVEASVSSSGNLPSIDYQWALSVNETDNSSIPGDDGTIVDTKTQVMPIPGSGMNESEKHFKKYVVVSDPNGIDDIAVVYGQLKDPAGVPMGDEVLATDITANVSQWTEAINLAFDNNLITEAAKDDMLDRLRVEKAGLKIYVVDNFLTNHATPGNYQVYFKVVDKGNGFEENSNTTNSIGLLIVEYMSLKAFETDFTAINYGPVLVNSRKIIAGDENWTTADRPTIKNQGNVDINLVIVASSMWGQDPDKVSQELPADYLGVEFMGEHVNSIYAVLPSLPGPGLTSPVTLQGVLTPCTPTQISFDLWIDPAYGVATNTYAGNIEITMNSNTGI